MATNATIQGADGRSMTGQALQKTLSPSTEKPAESRKAPEAPQEAPPVPASVPVPDNDEMEKLMSELRDALAQARPEPFKVAFRKDESSGDFVVEIRDIAGDLVKQFPPEKIVNLREKLDDLVGMVVDETT